MQELTRHDIDIMIAEDMGGFFADPLGYVMYMYPWGEGELAGFDGPDDWQREYLIDLGRQIKENDFNGHDAVEPIRMATTSGHGIGKSALVAWIANFILDTRPMAKGTVTANTSIQLETKTWPEIVKWRNRGLTKHWFNVSTGRGSMKMTHVEHKTEWFCAAQTCREENSESFAGQHAVASTSFYLFDEGSAIPGIIYEVAEGGLTDGEPMFFVFGNPTKNTGKFHEIFGKGRNRWNTRQIDSRSVKITNKKLIQQWVDDNGEDSDFVRVRVSGKFPRRGFDQFIPSDLIERAKGKGLHQSAYINSLKIVGVDIARKDDDQFVIIKRQGLAVFTPEKYRNQTTQTMAGRVASVIRDWEPDMVFMDMGNIGAAVYDILEEWQLSSRVTGVWFGSEADRKDKYANKRAEMWGNLRDLLENGLCLPDDNELCADLAGPEYGYTLKDQILLESKKDMKARGLASPDCGDALVLTTAYPVSRRRENAGTVHAVTNYNMFNGGQAKTEYNMQRM